MLRACALAPQRAFRRLQRPQRVHRDQGRQDQRRIAVVCPSGRTRGTRRWELGRVCEIEERAALRRFLSTCRQRSDCRRMAHPCRSTIRRRRRRSNASLPRNGQVLSPRPKRGCPDILVPIEQYRRNAECVGKPWIRQRRQSGSVLSGKQPSQRALLAARELMLEVSDQVRTHLISVHSGTNAQDDPTVSDIDALQSYQRAVLV